MFKRSVLKANAKQSLKRFYWTALLAILIVGFIGSVGGRIIGAIGSTGSYASVDSTQFEEILEKNEADPGYASSGAFWDDYFNALSASVESVKISPAVLPLFLLLAMLVTNVLSIGLSRFFLEAREKEAEIGNLFWGFKNKYGRNVGTMFLVSLFTYLWTLLLIIPGIIKGYEYSMIPYLLAENPNMTNKRAFELSKKMTKGYKWKLFVLELSFIGWYLLSFIVCCGISAIFLTPYISATFAEAYTFLKARALENGFATEEDFPGFADKTEAAELPAAEEVKAIEAPAETTEETIEEVVEEVSEDITEE